MEIQSCVNKKSSILTKCNNRLKEQRARHAYTIGAIDPAGKFQTALVERITRPTFLATDLNSELK